MLFSVADAKDQVVEGNFSFKQEGGEAPKAQGDCAGKCFDFDIKSVIL